jgi:undecaprenyl-diphosphatase
VDLIFQAIVMGLVQGLTEFIPVSSSAHLELTPWILGWSQNGLIGTLSFDVFLHLGTLLALLYRVGREWLRLLGGLLRSIVERRIGDDRERRLGWLLVLASIPAALIGFALEDAIESAFHGDDDMSRLAICGFLVIGAAVLFVADRYGSRQRDLDHIGPGRALVIGLSQAAALLPGISRSGATMSTGLAFGLTRETAARFSFLLATPITLGAGIYGSRHLLTASHTSTEWVAIAAGFAAAAISGAIAIGFLLRWLQTRSMAIFCLERVLLATLVLLLLAIGH